MYHCAVSDNGGVHINSGVDNHAYALLVDGGTYNGETVDADRRDQGCAHLVPRARSRYQHPATDFADHADALEQSCSDLTGVNLASLATGAPSGQAISAADCAQVANAIDAVEFRTAADAVQLSSRCSRRIRRRLLRGGHVAEEAVHRQLRQRHCVD